MRLNSEVLRACQKDSEHFDTNSEDWPGAEELCHYIERLEGEVLRLKLALKARDCTCLAAYGQEENCGLRNET